MLNHFHHQYFIKSTVVAFFAVILTTSAISPAHAGWKFWKKKDEPKIEVFQPPPADTMMRECDPIKRDIQNIYRKNVVVRHLLIPKREYLLSKHEKCKKRFADQEYEYLKHIEIANPKLDALPEEETNTSE